jgi:hypothetical protein
MITQINPFRKLVNPSIAVYEAFAEMPKPLYAGLQKRQSHFLTLPSNKSA